VWIELCVSIVLRIFQKNHLCIMWGQSGECTCTHADMHALELERGGWIYNILGAVN
jgi:hypothetical protein